MWVSCAVTCVCTGLDVLPECFSLLAGEGIAIYTSHSNVSAPAGLYVGTARITAYAEPLATVLGKAELLVGTDAVHQLAIAIDVGFAFLLVPHTHEMVINLLLG